MNNERDKLTTDTIETGTCQVGCKCVKTENSGMLASERKTTMQRFRNGTHPFRRESPYLHCCENAHNNIEKYVVRSGRVQQCAGGWLNPGSGKIENQPELMVYVIRISKLLCGR